jgi:hypothetical protein
MSEHASATSVRSALVPALAGLFLGGCGQSANDPASAPLAARPDVIITMDGKQHTCGVALYTEAQGSAVSCDDVVSFVRDELRLPNGAIYDLHGSPDANRAEMAKIETSLQGAGYRFIGGKKCCR